MSANMKRRLIGQSVGRLAGHHDLPSLPPPTNKERLLVLAVSKLLSVENHVTHITTHVSFTV